jgi:hypothetical protein
MAAGRTFQQRFFSVVLPTKTQAVLSLIVAVIILEGHQIKSLLPVLGVSTESADAAWSIFHSLSSRILTTELASNTALITFWATVGLAAYLICWAAYNVLIEARNEVTLETQYTNRQHWRGPFQTLALKAMGAGLLLASLAALPAGFDAWSALSTAVHGFSLTNVGYSLLAIIGMAVQLYLVLAFVLVAITPWYRPEAFTG